MGPRLTLGEGPLSGTPRCARERWNRHREPAASFRASTSTERGASRLLPFSSLPRRRLALRVEDDRRAEQLEPLALGRGPVRIGGARRLVGRPFRSQLLVAERHLLPVLVGALEQLATVRLARPEVLLLALLQIL